MTNASSNTSSSTYAINTGYAATNGKLVRVRNVTLMNSSKYNGNGTLKDAVAELKRKRYLSDKAGTLGFIAKAKKLLKSGVNRFL